MKLYILYHPKSDHARPVEEFAHEYKRLGHGEPTLLSLEEKPGAEMAKLYDIVGYPAVLAMRDSGELLKNWEGDVLPLMNEVAAYNLM